MRLLRLAARAAFIGAYSSMLPLFEPTLLPLLGPAPHYCLCLSLLYCLYWGLLLHTAFV